MLAHCHRCNSIIINEDTDLFTLDKECLGDCGKVKVQASLRDRSLLIPQGAPKRNWVGN